MLVKKMEGTITFTSYRKIQDIRRIICNKFPEQRPEVERINVKQY